MANGRWYASTTELGDAILLPNGKVLAEGGSLNKETPDTAGRTADLYDPVTNNISSGGTAAYSRL